MTMDQTVAATQEQSDPTEEQPVTAVAPGAEEAVSEAREAVPAIQFETDEDVLKFIEDNPRAKGLFEKRFMDGENTGKQRRDRELRLERGAEETAKAWQEHLAQRYGIELDEADRRDAPLWVKANRDRERVDYWRTHTEQVLDAFDITDRGNITRLFDQFDGLPDQAEALARQVIDTAVSRQTTRRIADLTLNDIPKDSKLWAEVDAYRTAEVQKELDARAQEREAPPPRPRTPVGSTATPRTRETYASLTPQQIADLPDDEYAIAQGLVHN